MRKLRHAKSYAPEMENKRVERFACESFYLLLLFFFLSALLFLSPLLVFATALGLLFLSSLWSSV